ncbi:MAG: DUF115 domain-containing protein [Phycisphaerae bacterium]|nr:DUF115 domain-containing protein [Phycisphaerae bacterium]
MPDVLAENLHALARHHGDLAVRIRDTPPTTDVTWSEAREAGYHSAVLQHLEGGLQRRVTLASRHRPGEEARRLAAQVNLSEHGTVLVLGFGLGYHVREILERSGDEALVVVYEPDLGLLRAVLEKLDCTRWLGHPALRLFAGEVENAELTSALEPRATFVVQGVAFLTHPPTRQLHGEAIKDFLSRFHRLVAYLRTNMATTLVQAEVTCRNLTANLGRYAAGSTVAELHQVAAGYPAVLVSAGPSLARNVHLLTSPEVRDQVVIIAAQTVLKPLLDRGVRPHFVTALDYHEISRRFYEDLPPLPDVTLVAEPKAHEVVCDSYPGPVRMLKNDFLDLLLDDLARPIPRIPAGATVAHLSFYLAQHLGCDPIILVGQDLGFSDGLYYCPGTAIHQVWAPELNAFNTVEMMELKRILRHKAHLQERTDIHGRSIQTDEQMMTYLAQFERDFAAAEQLIIDATEGGLPKQGAPAQTLAAALGAHARRPLPALPGAETKLDPGRLARTIERVGERIEEVRHFQAASRRTIPILEKMQRDQRDAKRMEGHFQALAKQRRRVDELGRAFILVNELNQVGAFNRLRRDRAIRIDRDLEAYEKQARQLQRDVENVRWIDEGCARTLELLTAARAKMQGQSRRAVGGRAKAETTEVAEAGA